MLHDIIKNYTLHNLENITKILKNVKNDTGYARSYSLKNLNLGLVPSTHIDPRCKVVSV
jgi:hypothetical protein